MMKKLVVWVLGVVICVGCGVLAASGNCLDFEHDDGQYAEIPLTLPDAGTIELWYNAESFFNYNTIFDNTTHENDWEMWIYESGKVRFRIEDGDLYYDLDEVGGTNVWHHIAVTWERHDSTNVNYDLWVNGIQRSALTNATWIDPGDTFYLGGGHSNNTSGDGMIDDVRIWSDVRTGAEIVDHMNVELNGNEADLLAYYRMNQIGGTNLMDAASGGYDGTLVNVSNDCWVASSAPIRHTIHTGVSPVHYVSPDGGNVWPFTNWVDAATDIQDAVDSAASNDTVRIGDGVYMPSDEIAVERPMIIESVNGPGNTVINGQGAHRCFNLNSNACTLSGFTVTNGYASVDGGGISCSSTTPVITNCVISGCSADDDGGGVAYGTLSHCTVRGNSCIDGGGGIYKTAANNSLIFDNVAKNGGGMCWGTAINCTLSENSANNNGGGGFGSALTNSIVWYNTASNSYDNLYDPEASYSCSPDITHGFNECITNAPMFKGRDAGNYRLEAISPCNNAGENDAALVGTDLDGRARITGGFVDMGAYEHTAPILVVITNETTEVAGDVELLEIGGTATEFCVGRLSWTNAANGTGGTLPASASWLAEDVPLLFGDNLITVSGTNSLGDRASDHINITRNAQHTGISSVHYVSPEGGNIWPYTNWVDAATDIQDAVDAAASNDTVRVADGVYMPSGEIAVERAMIIESVNGPTHTVVNGQGAHRSFNLGDTACTLSGFMITNGYASVDGGGISCSDTTPVITNCVISGCSADGDGGGVAYGTLYHCTVRGNSCINGGGGIYQTTANNSLILGNTAKNGGGMCWGTAVNCTLSENCATDSGGGGFGSTLFNSIVWYNTASNSYNNLYDPEAANTCSPDIPHDTDGCTTNAPLFVDRALGNYRLEAHSPCNNQGDHAVVDWAIDFEGNDRVVGSLVDMGIFEHADPISITITNDWASSPDRMLDLGGFASESIVGTMIWTNSANGENGSFPAATNWLVDELLLKAGNNLITVSGTNAFGVGVKDTTTIEYSNPRKPDLGNMLKVNANDVPVDALPDSQMCVFPDGDAFRALLLYKGLNRDGFVNIQARSFSLRDGRLESDALSRLMSAEYPENFLQRPRLAALDDSRVLLAWADVIRDGDLEEYLFRGLIYNIKTGEVGETVDLNERFVSQTFSNWEIKRVGLADDNKVFLLFNYAIKNGSLNNYHIKGRLISHEGTTITSVSESEELYTGNKYVEAMQARAHSFANDDRFMVLYKQENMEELKEIRGMVFQLDESEPNGWKCVNTDQLFYASQSSFSGSHIWLSGPYGNSVEDGSKFMASWEVHYAYEDYAVMAHITDDHQLVIDSRFQFDSSVSKTDFARHSFVENQEYAWMNWTINNDDIDINYTLMDCRVNPPVPIYEKLKVFRADKDRYWFNTLNSLPNGDILIAADGDTVDGPNWIKLFYIPVPSVDLSVSDSEGGETGDTRLAFTATQDAAEPIYVDVDYAISGTVSNGVDIKPLDGEVTLDGNRYTMPIPIDVLSDNESEGDETLTLQLLPGPGYKIGTSSNATVTVKDNMVAAPEVSGPVELSRDPGDPAKVSFSRLLSVMSDPNGMPLGIASVEDPSASNQVVIVNGSWALYLPEADFVEDDWFNYVVTNSIGGVAQGTVNISVLVSSGAERTNIAAVDDGQGGLNIELQGIPGREVIISGKTNLQDAVWMPLSTNTFDETGAILFNEPNPPETRFYKVEAVRQP